MDRYQHKVVSVSSLAKASECTTIEQLLNSGYEIISAIPAVGLVGHSALYPSTVQYVLRRPVA